MIQNNTKDRKEGLAPLVGEEPILLILGSLPSDISIAKQEYYANPTNLFWMVLAGVFDAPVPNSYKDKIALLNQYHVALWDSLHAANRKGSTDSAIRRGEPNDIASFVKEYPTIKVIVLNGGRAQRDFRKVVRVSGDAFKGISILRLPSTSSMIRSKGYTPESLLKVWKQQLTAYEEIRLQNNNLSSPVGSVDNGERTPKARERGLGTGVSLSHIQQSVWSGRVDSLPQKGTHLKPMGNGLYTDLWEKYLPVIIKLMGNGGGDYQLSVKEFEEFGNRKSYSFRIDIFNGNVPIKAGSAVARDLKTVLDSSPSFKTKALGKHVTIRLDSQFVLHVVVA